MVDKCPPDSLVAELKDQGYSDDVILELWKWYAPSGKEGVAVY